MLIFLLMQIFAGYEQAIVKKKTGFIEVPLRQLFSSSQLAANHGTDLLGKTAAHNIQAPLGETVAIPLGVHQHPGYICIHNFNEWQLNAHTYARSLNYKFTI